MGRVCRWHADEQEPDAERSRVGRSQILDLAWAWKADPSYSVLAEVVTDPAARSGKGPESRGRGTRRDDDVHRGLVDCPAR